MRLTMLVGLLTLAAVPAYAQQPINPPCGGTIVTANTSSGFGTNGWISTR